MGRCAASDYDACAPTAVPMPAPTPATGSCALRANTYAFCSWFDCSSWFAYGGVYEGECDTYCGLYSTCTAASFATCTAADYAACTPTAAPTTHTPTPTPMPSTVPVPAPTALPTVSPMPSPAPLPLPTLVPSLLSTSDAADGALRVDLFWWRFSKTPNKYSSS